MDEEELNSLQWNRLLNYFTINNVQLRRDRKKEALNSWRPIVEAILVYVRERHDYFATLQIFHSGSYYDRTKVGEPDEFDLMLVMENAVFYELKLPGLSNPPTGFAKGVMMNRRGGMLCNPCSATQVKDIFARLVREAIRDLGYERNVSVQSHGPAVTLKITNENGRVYSVDLTLAIRHESWPKDAEEWRRKHQNDPNGWPNQSLVQEICQGGCHLVEGQNPPEQEKGFLWGYSFSAAEKKLFLKGGLGEANSCRKQVLRIVKALREELNLEPLKSYHLKTIMFYECEKYPLPSQWSSTHLSERFLSLLETLENCLLWSNCPHYFIKNFNLFETFTQQQCFDLARKVREIRLQPRKVFIDLIVQSLQQSIQQAIEQSLMQTLNQAMEQALQSTLQQESTCLVLEQAVGQGIERALRHTQSQVREETLVQVVGALRQALRDMGKALRKSLVEAVAQELLQEFGQVLKQTLLEDLVQVSEQVLEQAWEQAIVQGQGQVFAQAMGQAMGKVLGQALGQALGITLEQSLEQWASIFQSFTYNFFMSSFNAMQ